MSKAAEERQRRYRADLFQMWVMFVGPMKRAHQSEIIGEFVPGKKYWADLTDAEAVQLLKAVDAFDESRIRRETA